MAETIEKPNAEEDGNKDEVSLDKLLIEEVGQLGRYQWRILALTVVTVIFAAWAAVEYIFTTGRIPTRCLIPECDVPESIEFRPSWLLNAVPESGSSFDNCRRFSPANATLHTDTCPASLFNRDNVVNCEEFLYENTDTVVYDYDLACDEWRRTLIGSVRTFGTLTALPITGFISDRWGRRTALSINAINTAWIGVLRYFADTYVGFLISQVAEATFGSGSFSCAYILLMEVVGPKYRVAAGATMNTCFSIGQITMGLIAWAVPDWRKLTLILYIPQFITIFYYWVMFESIRWYMSKGRYEDAEKTLKRVAEINGNQLSDDSIESLKLSAEKEKIQALVDKEAKKEDPWLIVILFRYKRVLLRVCVSPVWWITTTFIYYGMSINSTNMSGNRYVNYIAVAAVEIPGYWTAFLLMSIVGRRPVLAGAFWVCAVCQIAYIFIPSEVYSLSLAVYLVAKFSIAMVMTSVYVYTTELYPTKYRHTLFAFSSMMGRIGSIVAPLTPAFGAAVWEEFPFVLFACFALLSGALVLITPETLGSKLPDSMEDAFNIGLKKDDPNRR
ncbi:organic cation transporter protein-like [Pieris napi]|uniref:organic cation transporter protein-like n=1 Tax=Pieris napi TaxID=78633 RepID=UPI001FB95F10|nr:organic cation transporter protein-like [Pieris napi]